MTYYIEVNFDRGGIDITGNIPELHENKEYKVEKFIFGVIKTLQHAYGQDMLLNAQEVLEKAGLLKEPRIH